MKQIIKDTILFSSIFSFFYINNNYFKFNKLEIYDRKIPENFNDYKILHLSDIHNKKIPNYIINKIKKINPNIIVISGDLIDSYYCYNAIHLCKQLTEICPVYFVTGNHEREHNLQKILNKLSRIGVYILNNKTDDIVLNNEKINISGLFDGCNYKKEISKLNNKINENNFNILVSHRPEKYNLYTTSKYNLVLCGHAHGGQFRLPFIGGLYAPGQGIFPKLTAGVFEKNNTKMIVNRGIGNSTFPIRLFNFPEIICITLKK